MKSNRYRNCSAQNEKRTNKQQQKRTHVIEILNDPIKESVYDKLTKRHFHVHQTNDGVIHL